MAFFTRDFTAQHIEQRPFEGEDDFWRVRELLIDTYPITPTGFNWDIRHWDGWRFHRECSDLTAEWGKRVHLWETENGKLVGVAHPEYKGDVCLEIHPDFRHLIEEEMLEWGERQLTLTTDDGERHQLRTYVLNYDTPRLNLMHKRGYEKTTYGGMTRRLRFGRKPIPSPELADGYVLRTTRPNNREDCQRLADVLNMSFERSIHTMDELYSFTTQSPSFRHDLNLVAEAPNGVFAAHVGVTYDETNHRGIFEPVCTHPYHRRKGLARSLMLEGMRRLKALGATDVYVDTGDDIAANKLYEDVGFAEGYKGYIWRKGF